MVNGTNYDGAGLNFLSIAQEFVHDDVVGVVVEAQVGYDLFVANGVAKRDPGDDANTEIGLKLAMGRAVRQLGREILKDANRLVSEAAAVKQSQDKAREAARKRKAARARAAKKALK